MRIFLTYFFAFVIIFGAIWLSVNNTARQAVSDVTELQDSTVVDSLVVDSLPVVDTAAILTNFVD